MARGKKTGGRKKGSINKATAGIKELLDSTVDFNVVVEKLFELVQGVTVQDTNSQGDEVIYEEKPDANAAKILLAYRYGQPKQAIDVTSGDKPIQQNVIKYADGTEEAI